MNLSIFKKVSSFSETARICIAKTKYYGKMLNLKLMGRSVVNHNSRLIVEQLKLKNGKYCRILESLLKSCMANGEQVGLNVDRLYIKSISVGPAPYIKRREFKGRGRSGEVWRPHAKLVVSMQEVDFEPLKHSLKKAIARTGRQMEVQNGQ